MSHECLRFLFSSPNLNSFPNSQFIYLPSYSISSFEYSRFQFNMSETKIWIIFLPQICFFQCFPFQRSEHPFMWKTLMSFLIPPLLMSHSYFKANPLGSFSELYPEWGISAPQHLFCSRPGLCSYCFPVLPSTQLSTFQTDPLKAWKIMTLIHPKFFSHIPTCSE